jgi:hypothetical protein
MLTFASYQLRGSTSTTRNLRTFAWLHFDTMDCATYRDVAKWQAISGLHWRSCTRHQLITYSYLLGRYHIATLAIGIQQQCNISATVGVIFKTLYARCYAIFVTQEINETVFLLMATTLMTLGNTTGAISAAVFLFRFQQRRIRSPFVQIRINYLDYKPTPR